MARISARLTRGNFPALVAQHYEASIQQMEQAALAATDKAATELKGEIRGTMQAAGLGRLGNAIGSTSDLKKNGQVKRFP